ncbi:hypothetical protein [Fastidiosibacter lacustris]|uniref:hypothetical protein n=1 Tax=Fastidiosibacter lacustris TaxID=2056695 RepID=UPI000E344FEF|nr:hypothetical protein [Fastidiosibacter lacustris]
MKKLLSLIVMAIFLSGNIVWAENNDFVANSTMTKNVQYNHFKAASVESRNAKVYFQDLN